MIKWLMNEESGQGMVEYGLILALISVVVIVLLGNIGKSLKESFKGINDELDKAKKVQEGTGGGD